MSGHLGLREEARRAHLLARRIARLFPRAPQAGALACIEGRRSTSANQAARPG
jgi:hypothetical protein